MIEYFPDISEKLFLMLTEQPSGASFGGLFIFNIYALLPSAILAVPVPIAETHVMRRNKIVVIAAAI